MSKKDQIIYGNRLIDHCDNSIKCYYMAFNSVEHKIEFLRECIGYFGVLKSLFELCIKNNIIHYEKKGNKVSPKKIEIERLIGKIDNDMSRWLNSLNKAKNVIE